MRNGFKTAVLLAGLAGLLMLFGAQFGQGGLVIAFGLSTFGLIDLIAKGYGTISWGFFVVFIIPLMTLGIYKIVKRDK